MNSTEKIRPSWQVDVHYVIEVAETGAYMLRDMIQFTSPGVSTLAAIYIDGRSQIKVHTDERTQVHNARSSLTVTHPSRLLLNFSERATELALVATVSSVTYLWSCI